MGVAIQGVPHPLAAGWSYVIERNHKGEWRAVVLNNANTAVCICVWLSTREAAIAWVGHLDVIAITAPVARRSG